MVSVMSWYTGIVVNHRVERSSKSRPFIGGQDSPWTMLSVMLQCNYSLLSPSLVLSLRKQLKWIRNNCRGLALM